MIGATAHGSYRKQPGSHAVRVGIIDTGIDASHPDIAPNFDPALSRNFVTDMPDIDGPCEEPTCHDPADVDQGGHGTHVAGTVGAALNGVGIAGVAPKVDLVNLRAGQDSGYFFLQPTVNALTYAGDHGIDVVNMSFYIDPWLYNCADNPADSPAEQAASSGRSSTATQRALNYAHNHGVTLVVGPRQRGRRPRRAGARRHEPGLPAGHGAPARRRQLVPEHADRGQRRHRRLRRRPEQAQVVLLQLRHRADRRVGAGRRLARHRDGAREPGQPGALVRIRRRRCTRSARSRRDLCQIDTTTGEPLPARR